jgi:hypothetical protein
LGCTDQQPLPAEHQQREGQHESNQSRQLLGPCRVDEGDDHEGGRSQQEDHGQGSIHSLVLDFPNHSSTLIWSWYRYDITMIPKGQAAPFLAPQVVVR